MIYKDCSIWSKAYGFLLHICVLTKWLLNIGVFKWYSMFNLDGRDGNLDSTHKPNQTQYIVAVSNWTYMVWVWKDSTCLTCIITVLDLDLDLYSALVTRCSTRWYPLLYLYQILARFSRYRKDGNCVWLIGNHLQNSRSLCLMLMASWGLIVMLPTQVGKMFWRNGHISDMKCSLVSQKWY